jgi:hypothetical protein
MMHECRRESFETEARRGFPQGARAMNKERHVCARRRDGEPAVSSCLDFHSPSRRSNEKSLAGQENRTTE